MGCYKKNAVMQSLLFVLYRLARNYTAFFFLAWANIWRFSQILWLIFLQSVTSTLTNARFCWQYPSVSSVWAVLRNKLVNSLWDVLTACGKLTVRQEKIIHCTKITALECAFFVLLLRASNRCSIVNSYPVSVWLRIWKVKLVDPYKARGSL